MGPPTCPGRRWWGLLQGGDGSRTGPTFPPCFRYCTWQVDQYLHLETFLTGNHFTWALCILHWFSFSKYSRSSLFTIVCSIKLPWILNHCTHRIKARVLVLHTWMACPAVPLNRLSFWSGRPSGRVTGEPCPLSWMFLLYLPLSEFSLLDKIKIYKSTQ